MTPGPGIEPGTHWWEASALSTAPTLLSKTAKSSRHCSFKTGYPNLVVIFIVLT